MWPPINPSCLELSDPWQIHIHVDNFLYLQPSNLNIHYGKWFAAWILNTEMAKYPGWASRWPLIVVSHCIYQHFFFWKKVIKCASLQFREGHAQYHLLYHKADLFYWGTDIFFSRQKVTYPVSLLTEYTTFCDHLHGSSPALFLCENARRHPT